MQSIADTKQSLPQAVLSDVEQGMRNREFVFFYQPKIDLTTHRTVGVEALMRWRRDGRLVAPDDFIPVVEHSGILSDFTFMSIDLALEQMADWQRRGMALNVAVNISPRMLEDTALAQQLRRRLEQHAIPPELLTLEITETAIIANPQAARKVARQIADIGIKLSIDDFGAGFTSFTYLQEFSIAEINVDKQFIMQLQPVSFGASLVRCISAFCASEGIRVVAEGVEHKHTWPLLCNLGCNIGQGYSIARPAPAADLEAWLGSVA